MAKTPSLCGPSQVTEDEEVALLMAFDTIIPPTPRQVTPPPTEVIVIPETPPQRTMSELAMRGDDARELLLKKRAHGRENWLRREVMESEVPLVGSSPAAIIKFNDIVACKLEIMPGRSIFKQMEGRFMSLRIKQLLNIHLMTFEDIQDQVKKEWKAINNTLEAGHMILALWRMGVVLGFIVEGRPLDSEELDRLAKIGRYSQDEDM